MYVNTGRSAAPTGESRRFYSWEINSSMLLDAYKSGIIITKCMHSLSFVAT